MFKVNKDTRMMRGYFFIPWKHQKTFGFLIFSVGKERAWRRSGVFDVNLEHISHLVLVFLLLTLNM